jgi:O-antigen biosynthesis protein WbqP
MKKRLFDIIVVLIVLVLVMPLFCLLSLAVILSSKGPVLYWSKRVGKENKLFNMPKFRSMKTGSPVVATHLLNDPKQYLTPIGPFLRTSSLDELPQLWCILVGDMSLVGPRPALFNQNDLIKMRTECGVDKLKPGLTGWAQINGRDELPISEKVGLDAIYLQKKSFWFDFKIILKTISKVIIRDSIKH